MTCEEELHGSVILMVYSILSHIGTHQHIRQVNVRSATQSSLPQCRVKTDMAWLHCFLSHAPLFTGSTLELGTVQRWSQDLEQASTCGHLGPGSCCMGRRSNRYPDPKWAIGNYSRLPGPATALQHTIASLLVRFISRITSDSPPTLVQYILPETASSDPPDDCVRTPHGSSRFHSHV